MTELLKERHDQMLAQKPDGVDHDAANCVFCNPESDIPQGGDMTTYTEEQLAAAIKEAVAPIQAELDALRASHAEDEVEARVSAVKSELEAQIEELQRSLDAAEIKATSAESERDEVLAWLEAEAQAQAEAAEREARKSERLEVIKEAACFSDDHIERNIDRWVAMSDEDFTALVEDYKTLASASQASRETLPTGVPAETAINHTRTTSNPGSSALSELHELMSQGIDPRYL